MPGLGELRELLDQARTAGLEVTYTLSGTPRELPEGAELAAYRVVQESLTNTRKHAGLAATAAVTLRYERDGLTVEVTDNGLGVTSEDPGGHGLAGMRERIAMYGGTVTAGPLPGGGFGVTARLPCPLAAAARGETIPVANQVGPEPVSPEPVSPEPASPEPVSPEPVGTGPVVWSNPSLSGGVR